MNNQCALCQSNQKPLSDSHLIPKAIYDWIKSTSNTQYLRSTTDVNQRLQDGEHTPFLCPDCELYLSKKENDFISNLFKKIANYRQQTQRIIVSQDMLIAILSIFWRDMSNKMQVSNNRTEEDNKLLLDFLEQLHYQVKNSLATEKIYFAPMIGAVPYYNLITEDIQLQKELTYFLERSVGAVDVRFNDGPHRFIAILKLPFMFLYIFSDNWEQKELMLSHELTVGENDISSINTIPPSLQTYIQFSFKCFLESKEKINAQSLRAIHTSLANRPTEPTGSDKSYQRHLKTN